MRQDQLSPAIGSTKERKRVGRGLGSGHGTYSGRGRKGQKQRSGPDIPRNFAGGELSIVKRMPEKRGFVNIFKTEYSLVNIGQLDSFPAGSEVTPEKLVEAGIIKSVKYPVKVLAEGTVKQALTVKASKFSAAAKAKIEAAGGKAEELANAAKAD